MPRPLPDRRVFTQLGGGRLEVITDRAELARVARLTRAEIAAETGERLVPACLCVTAELLLFRGCLCTGKRRRVFAEEALG